MTQPDVPVDETRRAARCPVCGRPPVAATRPFCSVRCADVDLGRWLTGQYRLPGGATEQDDAAAPGDADPDTAVNPT